MTEAAGWAIAFIAFSLIVIVGIICGTIYNYKIAELNYPAPCTEAQTSK